MEAESPPSSTAVPTFCPSAPPSERDGVVLGVVTGKSDRPRIAYLAEARPVTEELLAITEPASPTAVFRFGAPCAGPACRHFDGRDCRLAMRVVELLPPVVGALPACHLRPRCRWWEQEGKAACLRCPQVVTNPSEPSDLLVQVAGPEGVQGPPSRTGSG